MEFVDNVTTGLNSLYKANQLLSEDQDRYTRSNLERARLLNSMGVNTAAEQALYQANNAGLLGRLLPTPKAEGWKAAGVFENPQRREKKALIDTAGITDKKQLAKIAKENDAIIKFNTEAALFNENIPLYRNTYEGDESEQLSQLHDDTFKAVKYHLSQGDKQAAAAAYNKYIQTGRAISGHYQHQFAPTDAKYFFGDTGGGGGGGGGGKQKLINYSIKLDNGKEVSIQLPEGFDPDTKQGRATAMKKLGLTGKDGNSYNPGSWIPLGSDSTYMNEKERADAERVKFENLTNMSNQIDATINSMPGGDWEEKQENYEKYLASKGEMITYENGFKKIVPITDQSGVGKETQQYKHLGKFEK